MVGCLASGDSSNIYWIFGLRLCLYRFWALSLKEALLFMLAAISSRAAATDGLPWVNASPGRLAYDLEYFG